LQQLIAAEARPCNAELPGSAEPGTVAICFVAAALQAIRTRQLDADALLRSVGIEPTLLDAAQARVSVEHYGALWRLVAQTLDDEFFAQDSRRMKSGSFAMLCYSVVSCKTLRQALDRSLRFYALILDDLSASVACDGQQARIVLHERMPANFTRTTHRVFAHETLLMLLHGVACWLVGRRIPVLQAEFAYAEPAHSAEYRTMYSTHLAFAQPHTTLTFDAGFLDLPVVQDESSVKEFLRNAPENILVKYKNANSLTAHIRRRLKQLLPDEGVAFDELAKELNMTPVTLRRRLREEGESYQSIKDQLRRDRAITYLSHTQRSVSDIALELGFAEPSAFHRAFRKWTGAAPSSFRRDASS
jgi:AraC-like DNA-binding protein